MAEPKISKNLEKVINIDIPGLRRDIANIIENDLTSNYLTPTVTKVDITSVSVPANPLPTTWVGSGSSYSNGGYTITTNMSSSGSNPLTYAFNGNNEDGFIGFLGSTGSNNYIKITLPEPLHVTSMKTYIPFNENISGAFIQGSNDDSNWASLYSYAGLDPALGEKVFTSSNSYKYYRVVISANANVNVRVNEIQLGNYRVSNYRNEFNLPVLNDYTLTANMRLMMKTPNYSTVGLLSNTLNGKAIDLVLLPNRYYELIYNGSIYIAKEVV